MRKIALRRRDGSVAAYTLVDDEDYDYLAQFSWHFCGAYAARADNSVRRGHQVKMATEIARRLGWPELDVIDHKNRRPLDNRRANLRPATFLTNARNRTPSPFTGRPRTLPDPEPRACAQCGGTFAPRRKTANMGARFCSRLCQRRSAMGKING